MVNEEMEASLPLWAMLSPSQIRFPPILLPAFWHACEMHGFEFGGSEKVSSWDTFMNEWDLVAPTSQLFLSRCGFGLFWFMENGRTWCLDYHHHRPCLDGLVILDCDSFILTMRAKQWALRLLKTRIKSSIFIGSTRHNPRMFWLRRCLNTSAPIVSTCIDRWWFILPLTTWFHPF